MQHLQSFVRDIPEFQDPIEQRQAHLLLTLLHVFAVLSLVILLVNFFYERGAVTRRLFSLGAIAVYLLSIYLLKQKRQALSANVFLFGWWFILTSGSASTGGLFTIGLSSYLSMIFTAGLLRGEWAAVRMTVINIATSFLLYYLSMQGVLTPINLSVEVYAPAWAILFANGLGICLTFFTARQLGGAQEKLDGLNLVLQQQNEALRQSEARHRAMIEQSPLSTLVFTAEGQPVFANSAAKKLWPFSESIVATLFARYNIFSDPIMEAAGLTELVETGFRTAAVQLPPIRYDIATIYPELFSELRGEFWLQSRIYPLRNESGDIDEVIVMVDDVTQRISAERAEWNAQKLEGIGLLAGGIAHDFNNLLTAIMAQASLAQYSLPSEANEQRALEKIVSASEQAAKLTGQLLAYAGGSQFEHEIISLNDLVEQNLHLFRLAIPHHVTLKSFLAPDLATVDVDPGQFQQVIMNLLINGAEAIQAEKGTVSISTKMVMLDEEEERQFPLTGRTLAAGPYVCLRIEDNGAGMDDETIARIFEPFYSTKETGRGLGLSAVLGIVRSHMGAFAVESTPGAGTIFTILLPASSQVVTPVKKPVGDVAIPAGRCILVIDDELSVRETVHDILSHAGATVLLATNGAEGIEQFQRFQANLHLIILDLTMPGMSGEETLLNLRQLDANIPVIISSGFDNSDLRGRLNQLSNDAFLAKPYKARELLQFVARILE